MANHQDLESHHLFESDHHLQTFRNLQIIEQRKTDIHVSLSIWAAQISSQDEYLELLNLVESDVLKAVVSVLCSVTDLRLVNRAATFFDPEILDMFDACATTTRSSAGRQGTIPAVVSAWADVSSMLRVSDDWLWSTWTITFPVLRIGDLYIEEALMNNKGISLTEIGDAAMEALEQVVQLALDVNMMEGELDDILHRTVDENILYAAPINQEVPMFSLAALDYEERFQFSPQSIYPMRVGGILMMLSSTLIFVMLIIASRFRRIRIEREAELFHRADTPSIIHFRDSKAVEKLLEQSSGALAIPPSVGATKRGAVQIRATGGLPRYQFSTAKQVGPTLYSI